MQTSIYRLYDALNGIDDAEERERVNRLYRVMELIDTAVRGTKVAVCQQYAPELGVNWKSLNRTYGAWKKSGGDPLVLIDNRRGTKLTSSDEVAKLYLKYCQDAKGCNTDGHRNMLRDFRNGFTPDGMPFPLSWRALWSAEHPGMEIPPRCPDGWIPDGWRYANLQAKIVKLPEYRLTLMWSRRGAFAALGLRSSVITTRVGLKVGAYREYDDCWHNSDVWSRSAGADVFNPLEFAGYDVASAFKCSSFIKARLKTVDPKTGKEKRSNLTTQQFRFLFAHDCIRLGFTLADDGKFHVTTEMGTTYLNDRVLRRIASIPDFGRLIEVKTSGRLNDPAHKGMFMGDGGGNPHRKALTECSHGILQHGVSPPVGYHGRDARTMHESTGHAVKYTQGVLKVAEKLAADERLLNALSLPTMEFNTYLEYFRLIEDEVMHRTDHRLEGWDANTVAEYRVTPDGEWRDQGELAALREANEGAYQYVMGILEVERRQAKAEGRETRLERRRFMSRAEVWQAGLKGFLKVPEIELPNFMDPTEDLRTAKVNAEGRFGFREEFYYGRDEVMYSAEYENRRGQKSRLAPGETARFFWNPLMPERVWLVDENGSTLGMAPLVRRVGRTDQKAIRAAMGAQAHYVADMMAETRGAHIDAAARLQLSKKVNAAVLDYAKAERSRPVTMGAKRKLAFEDVATVTQGAAAVQAAQIEDASEERDDLLSRFGELVSK